ncbi:MAG: glycosyltransferase family 2 protein [Betaproteobacteria bacterium]|nr:glycosyltransferase family 2 protein [Betaproteobacteria bacterium]
MPEITVIVLTFNEERNLRACLDSVTGWAKQVFVVDSYSTDHTVDIALEYGDRSISVVQHTFEDYSRQWNWALTKLPISTAWTLKLDADERVTEEFKEEVCRRVSDVDVTLEGIYFRRSFYFMRKRLEHSGNLGYDLRMWRTGTARFENRSVNEHAMVNGKVAYLKSYVEHVDHKALDEWISKHNRYSSLEALNAIQGNLTGDVHPRFFGTPEQRRVWLKRIYVRLPFGHWVYFVYHFIFCGGFLDGRGGFRYSRLRAQYQYWTDLKIIEYRDTGVLPSVEWPPRGAAHTVVANSTLQQLVDRG